MDFLKFFPRGRKLIIEFIPDAYIHWQPVKNDDIEGKASELYRVIKGVNSYCESHDMDQIIIIDCDKTIQYNKINYVLLCKLVNKMCSYFSKTRLVKIEIRHCNPIIEKFCNASKSLLVKSIADILTVYSNE